MTKLCPFNVRGRRFCLRAWLPLATTALLFWTSQNFAADAPNLPPLTTVSGSPRLPGKFVWADLVTDDVPAAQKFYSALPGRHFVPCRDRRHE